MNVVVLPFSAGPDIGSTTSSRVTLIDKLPAKRHKAEVPPERAELVVFSSKGNKVIETVGTPLTDATETEIAETLALRASLRPKAMPLVSWVY